MSEESGARVGDRRWRWASVGAAVGLVILAVILAVVGSGGDSGSPVLGGGPRAVSKGELVELEGRLGHAIYWAGERAGEQIELTSEADGNVYVRYLPAGVEVGDPHAGFLTVGTYPVVDAVGALRRTAAKSGSRLGRLSDGGVVLVNPETTESVYLAYPGSDLQIEVYSPAVGRAMRMIRDGEIGPVG